jgi:hypothetical protein
MSRPFLSESISSNIARFRKSGDLNALFKALVMVVRQGRLLELLYGLYCRLRFSPSAIVEADGRWRSAALVKFSLSGEESRYLSKSMLEGAFGDRFKVCLLPDEFTVRSENIVHNERFLILGEYRDSKKAARLAYVDQNSCVVDAYYNSIEGVRHIHALHSFLGSNQFLVSTGDGRKFLDLWTVQDARMTFRRRIKRRLAGYTAIIRMNGEYYFGTDFSSRPNCIETLDGRRYFFPKLAYLKYVVAFYGVGDRYLVSINTDLDEFGGESTFSVFDVLKREFCCCRKLDEAREEFSVLLSREIPNGGKGAWEFKGMVHQR